MPTTGEYQGVDMFEEMTVRDAVVAPYSSILAYAVGQHCLFGGAMYDHRPEDCPLQET